MVHVVSHVNNKQQRKDQTQLARGVRVSLDIKHRHLLVFVALILQVKVIVWLLELQRIVVVILGSFVWVDERSSKNSIETRLNRLTLKDLWRRLWPWVWFWLLRRAGFALEMRCR